ncbi:MAG: hypothetical protein GY788_17615 [bacterium]|nr:hypothetical protein [bacterium]
MALIRQWVSVDGPVAEEDAQRDRPRSVIRDTMWDLRREGHDQLATDLQRRFGRR